MSNIFFYHQRYFSGTRCLRDPKSLTSQSPTILGLGISQPNKIPIKIRIILDHILERMALD